jgi:tRNA threonylcarbamoyl adenosine modification protein (Sua5/YciO/YrdC/YwlC family)
MFEAITMTDIISIHEENPQIRFIRRAVSVLKQGGVVVYPSDSGYSMGCSVDSRAAVSRIKKIRQLEKGHLFTLLCRDLSEVSHYAHMSTPTYRLLKEHSPGAYTFILESRHKLSKILHQKRKTIGVRIPGHKVLLSLLNEYGGALLNVSLHLPVEDDEKGGEDELPLPVPFVDQVDESILPLVDLLLDSGACLNGLTSVIDFSFGEPVVVREGTADCARFL